MSRLDDIATKISAHLKRFESDPKINAVSKWGTRSYYCAGAWRAGSRVGVRYVSYQGESNLRTADAEKYLAWLDAGNEGRHWEALR